MLHLIQLMYRKNHGFTIVELLIAIVIIGVLASLVVVAFNGAQQRARDNIRIHDLKQLQKLVNLYYADNGVYPLPARGSGLWTGHCPSYGDYNTYIIGLSSYQATLPKDPRYDTSNLCYLYRSDGIDYMIIAHMTMESICGGDPSSSCNSPTIQALDRPNTFQPTIAVYSPGAATW